MRKSTLSHTTVILLQVTRFAKLNKPPLSFKPSLSIKPPLKSTWKNKPPGGLNRGFTVAGNSLNFIVTAAIAVKFKQWSIINAAYWLVELRYSLLVAKSAPFLAAKKDLNLALSS